MRLLRWIVFAAVVSSVPGCQPRTGIVLPAVADSSTALHAISSLKVIHRFNAASDVVVVRLYLLGGTRLLSAENAGIEALLLRAASLEHGHTTRRTGARHVLELTPDWSVTGFVGLREDLDSAWSGFASQLRRPDYSDAALERARGELLMMARRRNTEPDLRIHDKARRSAFEGHPYAIDPEGTIESLTSLSRADLERYWEAQFVTSRMLLVVVGPITWARIESLVTSTIGRLPAGQYEWTLPPPLPQREPGWLTEHQQLPTNYILGYFDGPSPGEKDYFAFRVAVAVLSADLWDQLREQEALSYEASAPFLDYARPIGGIYTSTSDPDTAMQVIRRTVRSRSYTLNWGDEPRGWDRFLDAFALDEMMLRLTSDGQAESLARAYLLFGDVTMADEYVHRIREVEFAKVTRVVREYVLDMQLAFMGDTTRMSGKW